MLGDLQHRHYLRYQFRKFYDASADREHRRRPAEPRNNGPTNNHYTDLNNNDTDTVSTAWFNDGGLGGNRIMQLSTAGGLAIKSTLTSNANFDLAEAFLATEPLRPGEVIAVTHGRTNAVRKSTGTDDLTVIGVVSTEPGIVLGGGAFSLEDVEQNWERGWFKSSVNRRAACGRKSWRLVKTCGSVPR
ncbi:MAG: hypothetical protein R3B90_17350 [Planctomycetaceae bacterium]